MAYLPIEQHGVIGDLKTVALVGTNGCIDFMCYPNFDSPSIFGALLDDEKGGMFELRPQLVEAQEKQIYLPDTNILLTRFLAADGVAEISDFMPVQELGPASVLVRRAKTVRGEIRYRMRCAPRFDYARAEHHIERQGDDVLFISEREDGLVLRLRSEVPVDVQDGDAVAEFTLNSGESATFILENAADGDESPTADPGYPAEAFKQTANYWRTWIGLSNYSGRWQDMVNRSALTLKLLTSWEHGSLIAAPTFGLPERIGGERNWDYRYTWVRDASFTLYALMRLGYTTEAHAFMHWIEDRCKDYDGDGHPLQVMYRLDGGIDLTERHLDHLEGYKGSRPVRIGNGARDQLQLDIYGELMDSIYLYNKYGRPIHHDLWANLVPIIDWVCHNWERADEGIWEVRGGRHEFLYSRLMCWVAIDRAVRLARKRSLPAPLDEWRKKRDVIYRDIYRNFWDDDHGAFMQYKGADTIDASSLLMPLVKFIGPDDPRWLSHLERVEEELVRDSLVYRYRPEKAAPDGLKGHEGTFSICSFWYVENLSRAGDLDKARLYFEKMLGYANHLGLYAEELGPSVQHLGNFPQAFTHLALISAAFDLNRRLSEAGWQA